MSAKDLSMQLTDPGARQMPAARSQSTVVESSRALAEVQSMVVVAQRFPRSGPHALKMAKEACGQLELANSAFFKFPRGGETITGESIHFARELARCWGNINYGIAELNRDDDQRVSEMVAFAWDLETNARQSTAFIVPHIRDTRQGPKAITETRDIYENNANMGARRLREMILGILPRWYVEACKAECYLTLTKGAADKPLAVRVEAMISAFTQIGISEARIKAKIGMDIAALTEIDLAHLGISYRSIQRKEISAEEEFPPVQAAGLSAELAKKTDGKHDPEKADPLKEAKEIERAAALGKADAIEGKRCDPDEHNFPTGPIAQAYIASFDANMPPSNDQGGVAPTRSATRDF